MEKAFLSITSRKLLLITIKKRTILSEKALKVEVYSKQNDSLLSLCLWRKMDVVKLSEKHRSIKSF